MEEIKLPDFDKLKDTLIDEIMVRVVERTPEASGAARRGWTKTKDGFYSDVDYIESLEDGWSDQAPNGMVRLTLEEAPHIIGDIYKKEIK